MAYEMKDNSGSLFKNDKREADTHAHAKGTALIDGVEYWIDAWTNTAQSTGEKYQSLKFKRKDKQAAQRIIDEKSEVHGNNVPDEDLPF